MIHARTVHKMIEYLTSTITNSPSHDYCGEDLFAMLNELFGKSTHNDNYVLWEWLNLSGRLSHFEMRVPIDSPLIPIIESHANIFTPTHISRSSKMVDYVVSVLELTRQMCEFREVKI